MKLVILAGGFGTRISEESHLRPKPMIEIGGRPIIWHIMKHYSEHGINEFVICCGYKGYMIKEYFANYFLHMSDVTIDLETNGMEIHSQRAETWKITLVDTGETTQTGGRIKRVVDHLDGTFCLTYGDGVSDVDLTALFKHHREHGHEATVTAIQPAGRFGGLVIDGGLVSRFEEKPEGDGRWINGGFFVCEPAVLDRISDDLTVFEKEPLESLAAEGQLSVWKHGGYWQSMDTLRDRNALEELWAADKAPWKTWE
ncbi:glucose-1-phosphate cytidylyltransferase [Pseudophaeobacter sp. EL27]|uniref:glucose-1-phosphate cytidylyltransferase n=1 Tax=Pseudophaeobacter sp. EL27 TaxID=2107580 RepID=UPI000EFA5F56|nr:glucose-1-phosphate cytidylyltransferase [Pseudophaeobacter sp. EL27]